MDLRPFVVLGTVPVLASLAVGACNGESASGAGGSGNSAGLSGSSAGATLNGGSSNGGTSNGGTSNGGTSGDSTGATSGSAGTDATGGAAGEAGGDPGGTSSGGVGGASGRGGSAGGGSGGSGPGGGGSSGTGGGGAAGMTGTLGERCSPRGTLACSGNHQKLTVLCGGDDTWQPNQTCGNDQFCDSTPGPNVGTCQAVVPGCEDSPGLRSCASNDRTLNTCGPDTVTRTSVQCERACHNAECRDDVSDCPDWDDYMSTTACVSDCGFPAESFCVTACRSQIEVLDVPAVIRTPWADEVACNNCSTTGRRVITIGVDQNATRFVRVSVPPPWGIGGCDDAPAACAVRDMSFSGDNVIQISAGNSAGPVNVVLEGFGGSTPPTCPQ